MKLIHMQGYSKVERQAHREIVFSNTVQSMQAVIEALPELQLKLHPANDLHAVTVRGVNTQAHVDQEYLPKDISEAVRTLWQDPAVREAVDRRREFQLNDSAT
jgi:guanine nucleotide-binding protein G(i) subunit alpha